MATDQDESPIEEARTVASNLDELRDEALHGVEKASENLDGARSGAGQLETMLDELQNKVERMSGIIGDMTGSGYSSGSDLNEAFEMLDTPYTHLNSEMGTLLSTLDDLLAEASDGAESTAEVTLGGEVYEVSFVHAGSQAEQPPSGDFGEHLASIIRESDTGVDFVAQKAWVDYPDADSILNGQAEATREQADELLSFVRNEGVIDREAHEDLLSMYFTGVEPDTN